MNLSKYLTEKAFGDLPVDIENAKTELMQSLKGKVLVRDLSKNEISIATGGKWSVKVKILGYSK